MRRTCTPGGRRAAGSRSGGAAMVERLDSSRQTDEEERRRPGTAGDGGAEGRGENAHSPAKLPSQRVIRR